MKPSTLCAAAILAAGALAISSKVQGQNKSAPAGGSDRVARGRYLTLVGGCGDCHSPKKVQNGQPLIVEGNPVEDQSRLLSGHRHDHLPLVHPPDDREPQLARRHRGLERGVQIVHPPELALVRAD